MHSPGTMPAMNSAPADVPETAAYTTIVMLGGMIGPIQDDAAVMQHEVSWSSLRRPSP